MKTLISSILTGVLLVLRFICLAPVAQAQIFAPPCVNPVVMVQSAPAYGYHPTPTYRTSNIAVSTVGGAAIGALVSSRHDTGKGALIGAGAGLLVGLIADRAPAPAYSYGYAQPVYSSPGYGCSAPYSGYGYAQPPVAYYPTGWIPAGTLYGYGGGGYGHEHYGHDRDGGRRR